MSDTICAIATAPATAALGIIRVSGPKTKEFLSPLLQNQKGEAVLLCPRKATLCRIVKNHEVYD